MFFRGEKRKSRFRKLFLKVRIFFLVFYFLVRFVFFWMFRFRVKTEAKGGYSGFFEKY